MPTKIKKLNLFLLVIFFFVPMKSQTPHTTSPLFQPLSFEEAFRKADSVVQRMTDDELISYIGGDRGFFIRSLPRLGIEEVYMTDATQGVHIRESFRNDDLSKYQLEKSTAFPCPLALTATWNTDLAYRYARAIGEECRAGGIGILLGPGLNHYRHSQCGRNFEYFGEDPYLRSQLIAAYVTGVQSTGTVATLKHFIANNTDFFRRKSNSIIDERTLHEIYLPGFKAGIDAGAKAVMTSYNLLNGEWCGQSEYVIKHLLRNELGFQWLVMTDWWSVWDGEKVVKSGQDLEMPKAEALKNVRELLAEGRITKEQLQRMARSILTTYFAMRLGERKPEPAYYATFPDHERIALETAREAIVLLKNESSILPLDKNKKKILLTGAYVETLAAGGGSAEVKGYNVVSMLDALLKEFGARIEYVRTPTDTQLASADIVLCNVGTSDSEGYDRPFELPQEQEELVLRCVQHNPNTVVIVTSGSGIRMTNWASKAKAILYAWYVGQNGNVALAEILAGKINPSGRLPITIEREFRDSPGYGYIPDGEQLYTGWNGEGEKAHPVYDVVYKEGIFTGYRWYEEKNIAPLFPFGYGLSYTTFRYADIRVSKEQFRRSDTIVVQFRLTNTGNQSGKEVAQLYIHDIASSQPRPPKELKGFVKVELVPGESKTITMMLDHKAFSFWNPEEKKWVVEPGEFDILVGSSVQEIHLRTRVKLVP